MSEKAVKIVGYIVRTAESGIVKNFDSGNQVPGSRCQVSGKTGIRREGVMENVVNIVSYETPQAELGIVKDFDSRRRAGG